MLLLREEWEPLEADFTRYYNGADLRALCWGDTRWSARRILAHIQGLPRDSAFARKIRGEAAYWDETPEMLTKVLEAIERQSYYFRKINFEDPGPAPEPLWRPGQPKPESQIKTISLSEWARTL